MPEETDERTTENWIARAIERTPGKLVGSQVEEASALRAALNEELGFYPANLDDESIAEYRRKDAEYRKWYAGYLAKYGPNGSHRNQFRHLRRKNN